MGWTGVASIKGASKLENLAGSSSLYVGSSWDGPEVEIYVEALQAGPGGVYGILRETTKSTGKVVRLALVVMTQNVKGEFLYKEMTELCGPTETRYPLSFLRRLSPVEEIASGDSLEWARNWRARVEKTWATKASAPKLQRGVHVRFNNPVTFTFSKEQVTVTRFKILEWGRRKRVLALPESGEPFTARLHRDTWASGFIVEA
jgi:hypothetical protein